LGNLIASIYLKMKKVFLLFVILVTSCSTYKEPSQDYIQKNNYLEVIGDLRTAEGNEIIDKLDRSPMFPNGNRGVSEYIGKNFRIPADVGKIKGRVIVKFVVNNKGNITYAEIVESLEPKIDKEAIRVIKSMKNWIPARLDNETFGVLFRQPIQF
jgi:TonB family protein